MGHTTSQTSRDGTEKQTNWIVDKDIVAAAKDFHRLHYDGGKLDSVAVIYKAVPTPTEMCAQLSFVSMKVDGK